MPCVPAVLVPVDVDIGGLRCCLCLRAAVAVGERAQLTAHHDDTKQKDEYAFLGDLLVARRSAWRGVGQGGAWRAIALCPPESGALQPEARGGLSVRRHHHRESVSSNDRREHNPQTPGGGKYHKGQGGNTTRHKGGNSTRVTHPPTRLEELGAGASGACTHPTITTTSHQPGLTVRARAWAWAWAWAPEPATFFNTHTRHLPSRYSAQGTRAHALG